MRIFLAINLPSEMKNYLEAIQVKLAKNNKQVKIKWVEKENLHLTLFFLGEQKPAVADDLAKRLKRIIKIKPFKLTLGQLGAFPNNHQAKIIKISLQGNHELQSIYKDIREQLAEMKFEIDQKPFCAHVTLGRIKSRGVKIDLFEKVEPLNFEVKSVALMKSELTSAGPVYEKIA